MTYRLAATSDEAFVITSNPVFSMPIKHAIWKVGKSPEPLNEISLATEQQLEDMIVGRPGILSARI